MGRAITASGSWRVKAWPTCGEASVTFVRDRRESVAPVLAAWQLDGSREMTRADWDRRAVLLETNEDRSVRRSRTSIRRYNRHNGLTEMVTLTFAGEPPEFDSLSAVMSAFWKRFERATGRSRGPYCWVPEWGKKTNRLHVHMAVDWWGELNCVEVCIRCDKYGVLNRFKNDRPRLDQSAPGNRTCVGCLWGHGFVGRPVGDDGTQETNEDGRALSKYLSKYLGKDLDVGGGRQRYRVGEGAQPEAVLVDAESPDEGVSLAMAVMSDTKVTGESHMDQTPIMFVM